MRRLAFWLLLLFVFSVPLEYVIFGAVLGSPALGLLAFAGWILAALGRGSLRRPTAVHWLATGFVAWALLSYFWSPVPVDTLTKVSTLVQMVILVWMIWDQVDTRARLVAVMRAFVLSSVAAALLGFVSASGQKAATGSVERFTSASNAGPNGAGCMLAIAIAIAWYLLQVDEDRRFRKLYVAFIPVGVTAVFLTASRTALLSVAVVAVIVLLQGRNLRPRRLLLFGVIGMSAAVLAVNFVPERATERLGTTGQELSGGTLSSRKTYWSVGWEVISEHPLAGIAAGAFGQGTLQATGEQKVAHNVFVSILAELGAIGLILFLLSYLVAGRGLGREPPNVRRAWLAILGAWLVAAGSLSWETRKVTWMLLVLLLVQTRMTRPDPGGSPELPSTPEQEGVARPANDLAGVGGQRHGTG